MIHDAQRPGCPFQYLLVYAVKRFGRLDNDETGHHRYLLRKAGVEVIHVAENFNGVLSPRNGKWSKMHGEDWAMTSIRDILMNPAYAGDAVWNRRSLAKFYRVSGKAPVAAPRVRQRAIDRNDKEDRVVTRDAHPALVPRHVFDEAQRLRKQRRGRHTQTYRGGRGAKSNYLLTSVIVCDRCGHRWQGYRTNGGKKRKDGSRTVNEYYACGGYVMKGNSVCKRDIIQRHVIEGLVIEAIGENIRQLLEGADPIEPRSLVRQHLGVTEEGASEELRSLRAQGEEIRAKINNILDNITRENREFADERIAELKRELLELNPRIEELQRTAGMHVDLDEAVRAMTDMLSSFGNVMKEGSIDEQRRVIRAFVRQIRLDRQNHEGRAEVFALPALRPLLATKQRPRNLLLRW